MTTATEPRRPLPSPPPRRASLHLALALAAGVAASLPALPLAAQEPEPESCRCVDRSGEEIENCTCFRMPDTDVAVDMSAMWGGNRARIGVTLDPRQPGDLRGARIGDVLEGGPADRAGLREGDVITALDGRSLARSLEEGEDRLDLDESVHVQRLLELMADVEPGEELRVTYRRDDETRETTVVAEENPRRGLTVWRGGDGATTVFPGPGERRMWQERMGEVGERLRRELREQSREWRMEFPEGEGPRVFGFRSPGAEGEGPMVFLRGGDPCMEAGRGMMLGFGRCLDGVEFEDVNPELGEYFGVEEGVLVTEVREGATLGLQAGDVVVEVDGRPVTTVERLRRILRSYDPEEEIEMRIVRKGETLDIQGRRR